MSYPRPTTAQLRYGLHALVVSLVVVVVLRAVLLDERHPLAVAALGAAFVAVYLGRTRTAGVTRALLLAALVVLWLGLLLVGADASYASVGLFLVLLTELAPPGALIGVVAITAVDAGVGLGRGGGLDSLVAPVLGAVLTLLLGVGFRVLLDSAAEQQALIDTLRRTRDELAIAERAAGQAVERQRLAGEIHDSVAQGLSSIQMLLRVVEADPRAPGAAAQVALARETAGASLTDARRLVAELGPADLAGSSLPDALARICERSPVPVTLHLDDSLPTLPMAVEAAVVRITQSALGNVEQHAGAGARAVVTLGRVGDEVHLDVVDDGVGIDASRAATSHQDEGGEPRRGVGLATIRARTAELGGGCTIESERGRTALAVVFPLRDEETS